MNLPRFLKKKSTQNLIIAVALLFFLGWFANQTGIMEGFEGNTETNKEKTKGTISSNTETFKKSDIKPGDEDLYILKSQIVPPVCPRCPEPVVIEKNNCPPCPACERCPEPTYKCEMVPNYDSGASDGTQMPRPFLNDFSQF